jgi:hypothetical protein
MKNEREKSDPSKVAKRPANKQETAEVDLWGGWAESAEPSEEGFSCSFSPSAEPSYTVPPRLQ